MTREPATSSRGAFGGSFPLRRLRAATARGFHAARHAVMTTLFPPRCLICGNGYHAPRPDLLALAIRERFPDIGFDLVMSPYLCVACGVRFTPDPCLERRIILDGIPGTPMIDLFTAVGIYEQSLKTAIHELKYRGRTYLAKPLGLLLLAVLCRHWPPGSVDLILPMPLHWRRLRKRGFNQVYLMMKQWADLMSIFQLPFLEGAIRRDMLYRVILRPPQVGLSREERLRNVAGVFSAPRPWALTDKRVLLVDDVVTTGATVHECARILREAGAAAVDVLALAHTPRLRGNHS